MPTFCTFTLRLYIADVGESWACISGADRLVHHVGAKLKLDNAMEGLDAGSLSSEKPSGRESVRCVEQGARGAVWQGIGAYR